MAIIFRIFVGAGAVTVLSSDIRPALPNETIRFTHKNRKNMKPEYKPFVDALIELAIREDIGDGDHTSLCCIPATEKGRMRLLLSLIHI